MDMENLEVQDSAKVIATDNIVHQNQQPETKPSEKLPTEINATSQDTLMENAADTEVADVPASPPLTHALEALLGGLDPPVPVADDVPTDSQVLSPTEHMPEQESVAKNEHTVNELPAPAIPEIGSFSEPILTPAQSPHAGVVEQTITPRNVPTTEDIHVENAPIPEPQLESASATAQHAIPGLFLGNGVAQPVPSPKQGEAVVEAAHMVSKVDVQMGNNADVEQDIPMAENAEEEEHPEWEVDSSPIESSSDDSSSDDSSDEESEDGDNTYKLLSPEEQARILMDGDGGSDDEGGGKAKGTGAQMRTKNEVPDVIVPKPDVVITAEMPITEVGNVEHIVENVLVIKAKTSGENRALESGSVLCLEDRSVIGVVAEILGPVQKPLYSVMFTNAGEISEAGLSLGTKVFYSEKHSTFVFTQALKAYKGSDASNLHDEEVGDEEMEFSDDEAEAEHKRRVKQKRMERRGGKMQNGGPDRGGHPLRQQHTSNESSGPINYDDAEEDGPYRPLARPVGFENAVGHGEAPQESPYIGSYERPNREQFKGRVRVDRGRGDRGRGRGRGDRGRGRGGFEDRRGGGGYSLPPRPQSYSQPSNTYPPSQYQQPHQGRDFSQVTPVPPAAPNFFMPPAAYSPQQPQMAWPQYPPQFQQPFQSAQNSWQPPSGVSPQGPPAPGGAYINPAFLPGPWNNQNGQNSGAGGK